jgi:hypothetical protein
VPTHYDEFDDTLVIERDEDSGDIAITATENEESVDLSFPAEAVEAIAADLIGSRGSVSNPSDLNDPRRAWNDHVFGLAAQFGRLVIFDYQKDGSLAIERRKLRPDTVENGVATGHDLSRSDIRAFRLDRVRRSASGSGPSMGVPSVDHHQHRLAHR